MSTATALNWRRSVFADGSPYPRSLALGQHASTVVALPVEPIWAADAPTPLGRPLLVKPDVTMLAVVWGRQGG